MPAVQQRRINWFRQVPIWKSNEAWRKHHAAVTSRFLDNTAAAANSFTTAVVNQVRDSTDITTQIAIDRIQAAAGARSAAQSQTLNAQLVDLFA